MWLGVFTLWAWNIGLDPAEIRGSSPEAPFLTVTGDWEPQAYTRRGIHRSHLEMDCQSSLRAPPQASDCVMRRQYAGVGVSQTWQLILQVPGCSLVLGCTGEALNTEPRIGKTEVFNNAYSHIRVPI